MNAEKLLLSILGMVFVFFLSVILIVNKCEAKGVNFIEIDSLENAHELKWAIRYTNGAFNDSNTAWIRIEPHAQINVEMLIHYRASLKAFAQAGNTWGCSGNANVCSYLMADMINRK